jgi:hypothetical protein
MLAIEGGKKKLKEKSVKTELERLFGYLRENTGRLNYKYAKKGRYPLGNGESIRYKTVLSDPIEKVRRG